MVERSVALDVVRKALTALLEEEGSPEAGSVDEATVIIGAGAVMDSVAVVALIVEIEQELEITHGISVTLASEKAMSQRSSPFRTLGTLVDHICVVAHEEQAAQ